MSSVKDFISDLPLELALNILGRLPTQSILTCSLVNRTWSERCKEQALWYTLCIQHEPPIYPSFITRDELEAYRSRTRRHSTPRSLKKDEADMMEYDPIFSQSGMGGFRTSTQHTAPHGPFRPTRKLVYGKQSLLFSLPSVPPSPALQSPPTREEIRYEAVQGDVPDPIKSDLDGGPFPQVNYKHLYFVHQKLKIRLRTLNNPPYPRADSIRYGRLTEYGEKKRKIEPLILDLNASIVNGGLPGHREAIYTLAIVRHPMVVPRPLLHEPSNCQPSQSALFLDTPSAQSIDFDGERANHTVIGRDWILSGSRDKTLRLWTIDTSQPRVVKVFQNGHTGSILCQATIITMPLTREESGSGPKDKLYAVTGGNDGRLCIWDVEVGDRPVRSITAHSGSILCVKADKKRVVSCSSDRTINVFALPDLTPLVSILVPETPELMGAINSIGLSKNYIISGSADKTLRVWCIDTGKEIASIKPSLKAGISTIHFEPCSSSSGDESQARSTRQIGTIYVGSNDASIKIYDLFETSYTSSPSSSSPSSSPSPEATDQISHLQIQRRMGEYANDGNVQLRYRTTCRPTCTCSNNTLSRGEGCPRCLNNGHVGMIRSLTVVDNVIISGGYDGTIRTWDAQDGRGLSVVNDRSLGILLSVTGNRLYLASAGTRSEISLWNLGQGLDAAFVIP